MFDTLPQRGGGLTDSFHFVSFNIFDSCVGRGMFSQLFVILRHD